MKNKEYIKPEINVIHIQEIQSILTGSQITKASDDDYNEENVDDYRDTWGNIWSE